MLTAFIIFFLMLIVYFYLIVPEVPPKTRSEPFVGVNYAHRGLYNNNSGIPENSLEAFLSAVDDGYGIELDIRLTRDGKIVVFHDDNLERMCGINKNVEGCSYEELKRLRLLRTDSEIPEFSCVLDVINGKIPLLVELKSGKKNNELCKKSLEMLRKYTGKFCVQSFDPTIVGWFRRNAPDVFRGQLVASMHHLKKSVRSLMAFAASHILLNCYARPQFLSHRKGKKSVSVKLCEFLGACKFVWTVDSMEDYFKYSNKSDSVIFEKIRPKKR